MTIDPHPYAEIFPLHGDDRLNDLIADIKANGLMDPITVYHDKILDGRRRDAACAKAGVEPRYEIFKGDDKKAFAFVISKNLPRRHLSDTERAFIAAKIANVPNGGAFSDEKFISRVEAAKMMDVAPMAIDRARMVEDAVPELKAAVLNETLTLTDAAAISDESPKIQKAAIKEVVAGNATTAAGAAELIHARKDRAGQKWPARLLPAVEANIDLNRFRMKIRELADQAKEFGNGPLAAHINWTELSESLEKICKTCLNGKVDYLCCYCQTKGVVGGGITCKKCRGSGFLPEKIWKDSPAAVASMAPEE